MPLCQRIFIRKNKELYELISEVFSAFLILLMLGQNSELRFLMLTKNKVKCVSFIL